jgi:hypothetical protein
MGVAGASECRDWAAGIAAKCKAAFKWHGAGAGANDDKRGNPVKPLKVLVTLASVAALAGCASATGELRSNLRDFGMNNDEARCVSRELDDSLTNREIRSINRVLEVGRDDRRSRPSRVINAVGRLNDPDLLAAVTVANAGCLLLN